MKRRKAREYALQFLYRIDFINMPEEEGSTAAPAEKSRIADGLELFWKETSEEDPDIRSFTEDIVSDTIKHLDEIDAVIQRVAEKWKLSRIANVDRNIMRFAAYELLYRSDIPDAVSINEALEIAKKYSAAESASFINGILDKIAKEYKKKRL